MHLHHLALLRIVCEKRLAPQLLALLSQMGAGGYTMYDVTGAGEHGERAGATPETTNVAIEVLTTESAAEAMLLRVHETFLPKNALIAYILAARGFRRDKFL